MKKKVSLVLFILIYLICVAIMDYPFVARIHNEKVQAVAVLDYEERAEKLKQRECEAELLKAEEYNKMLSTGMGQKLGDAFGKTEENNDEYENVLNTTGDGIMGWIEIPAIQVTLPIYHGTSEKILLKGAGHLEGTSLPTGGVDTHTVISAHRGIPSKKMFTDLDQIGEGDVFYIHILQNVLAYQVTMVETVTLDDIEALAISPGEELATLVTCTPYGMNTHRLYVHGKRIAYTEGLKHEQEESGRRGFLRNYWWVILSAVMTVWMGILVSWYCRNEKKEIRRKGGRKRRHGKKKMVGKTNGRNTCSIYAPPVGSRNAGIGRRHGKVDI